MLSGKNNILSQKTDVTTRLQFVTIPIILLHANQTIISGLAKNKLKYFTFIFTYFNLTQAVIQLRCILYITIFKLILHNIPSNND